MKYINIHNKTFESDTAKLVYKNQIFENVRIVFQYNPYYIRNCYVIIKSEIKINQFEKEDHLCKIVFKQGVQEFTIHIEPHTLNAFYDGWKIDALIVEEKNVYRNSQPAKTFVAVHFPMSNINNNKFSLNHSQYGLIKGEEKEENQIILEDESYKFQFGNNNYFFDIDIITSDLNNLEENAFHYNTYSLSIGSTIYSESIENVEDTYQELDLILSVLSFVERSCYSPINIEFNYRDENNDWIGNTYILDSTKYWPAPKKNRKLNASYIGVRKSFDKIITKVSELEDEKLQLIKNLLNSYKIANLSSILEDSFLKYHSCLDQLVKAIKVTDSIKWPVRPNYSIKLNIVLEKYGIKKEPLLYAKYSSGEEFYFNKLRNDYVHDSLLVDRKMIYEYLNQKRNMIILFERLFLRWIGINYKETILGEKVFI